MTKLSKYQRLIDKKPQEMSIIDWYKYMNSCYIIKYNLFNMKIPNSKPICLNNQPLHMFYKTPELFLDRLKRTFNPKWVDKYSNLFIDFYKRNYCKIFNKMWLEHELSVSIINKSFYKRYRDTELIFYIRKGYNLNEGEFLRKQKLLNSSPMRIDFWKRRGLTDYEARSKILQICSNSKGMMNYWTKRGCNNFEAETNRLNYMKSLNFNNKSHYDCQLYDGLSEEEKRVIITDIMKKKSPSCKEYYIEKGFDESKAVEMAKKHLWDINPMNVEKYIRKGVDIEQSKQIVSNIARKRRPKPIGGTYAKLFFELLEIKFEKNKNLLYFDNIFYGYKNKEFKIKINPSSSFYKFRKYIKLDFFIIFNSKNLLVDIEYDHKDYHKNILLDEKRDEYLKKYENIHVIRVTNDDFSRYNINNNIIEKVFEEVKLKYENS